MVYDLPIDDKFEITSTERAALARIAQGKDWDVLVAVMSRFFLSKSWDLTSHAPVDDQNVELVRLQGGTDMLRKMVEFVETSEPAPEPRRGKK